MRVWSTYVELLVLLPQGVSGSAKDLAIVMATCCCLYRCDCLLPKQKRGERDCMWKV